MSDRLAVGDSLTRSVGIDRQRTIGFMGEEARVYATPWLVHDIEHACRDLILSRIPEGEDSVGISVSVTHTAPTPLGMEVEITVTVAAVEGRRVRLEVSARDPVEPVCKGSHERFIVDVEQTKQRLLAKIARAGQG